jgi:ribonuclease Z
MGLQGREEGIHLYGPKGAEEVLISAIHLGVERVPFPVRVRELSPGETVGLGEYEIVPFRAQHGTPALGYALREYPRLGRFDVDRARALGVPEGPLFGQLHRGEAVEVGGRTVRPEEVVGEPRPGRLVVYTGDTRPTADTLEMSRGADLLIHEATFGEEEVDRAKETFHATAREAAALAEEAGVDRLILTHISARHSENPGPLADEARAIFPATVVAHDGLTLELGYRADEEGPVGESEGGAEGRVHG